MHQKPQLISILGTVINVFEAVDVIAVIKGGNYDDLNLSVGEALLKRSEVGSSITLPTLMQELTSPGLPRNLYLHTRRPARFNIRHDSQVTRS